MYKTTCRVANAHDAKNSNGKMYDQSTFCTENKHIERTQVVIFRCTTANVSPLSSLDKEEDYEYNDERTKVDQNLQPDSTQISIATACQRGLRVLIVYLCTVFI